MPSKSRRWTWTLNNYTDAQLDTLNQVVTEVESVKYLCYGIEIAPTTGTPHLQGYMEVKHPVTMARVKTLLGSQGAHVTASQGTPQQNREYCSKDGLFHEFGEISAHREGQGRRTDLDDVRLMIEDGRTDLEIAQLHFNSWVKYQSSFNRYRSLLQSRRESPKFNLGDFPTSWQTLGNYDYRKSLILWGESGIGKTEFAKTLLPDALFVSHIDDLILFNDTQYHGLIFDDMSFTHLPRESQIHLCDIDNGRSIHVRYQTAFIPSNTKKIFTTNILNGACFNTQDSAIKRRLSIHHLAIIN